MTVLTKIGSAWIDPSYIAAVEFLDESTIGWSLGDMVTIHLTTGSIISLESSPEAVEQLLIEAGLLAEELPAIELTEEETDELRHLYAMGCSYIARDRDGKAYAYRAEPTLDGAYWETGDGHPAALLEGDYDFLEPAAGDPVRIDTLLAAG